jgi:hypothetical protein
MKDFTEGIRLLISVTQSEFFQKKKKIHETQRSIK